LGKGFRTHQKKPIAGLEVKGKNPAVVLPGATESLKSKVRNSLNKNFPTSLNHAIWDGDSATGKDQKKNPKKPPPTTTHTKTPPTKKKTPPQKKVGKA